MLILFNQTDVFEWKLFKRRTYLLRAPPCVPCRQSLLKSLRREPCTHANAGTVAMGRPRSLVAPGARRGGPGALVLQVDRGGGRRGGLVAGAGGGGRGVAWSKKAAAGRARAGGPPRAGGEPPAARPGPL